MNHTQKETFDDLWNYCTSNNRLCPIPSRWNVFFGMLKGKKQNLDGSWTPSLPLILSGWEHTVPLQKFLVFQEHIKWASDHNQLDEVGQFLRNLTEDEWAHYGEI